MTEKVKLPREVAEAFEGLEVSWNLTEVFKAVTADYKVCDSRIKTLVDWNESGRDDEGAGLMQLLLGQYEIEPKHKYGDWVTKHYSDLSYLIGRVNQVRSDGMVGVFCSDENIVFIPYEELSASTPDEIKAEKERRAWAKIGREVGEFKKDDVVRCLKNLTWDNHYDLGEMYKKVKLKGFYPAESFISFEDGESNA